MLRPLLLAIVVVISGCGKRDAPARLDRVLLDEQVSLTRAAIWDEASRKIYVDPGTTVVAMAYEQGADITLRIEDAVTNEEVDSTLQGEGLEISLLKSGPGGKVDVRMRSSQAFESPGTVRLVLLAYPQVGISADESLRVTAFAAWARATRASLTRELVESNALADIDRVISTFDSTVHADPALAAMARLVRARMLYMHEVDWRESAREADRASAAFSAANVADRLNAARARRLQAAALQELSADQKAVNPTAAEASVQARFIYAGLLADDSPLDHVGRGRVQNFLGLMDLDIQAWRSAGSRFDAALREYKLAGFRAGTLQTLRNMALLAYSRGDFATAARNYSDALVAIGSLADWDARAGLLINAAINDINAGDTDSAIARLLDAGRIADDQHLLPARGRALHGLGFAYWARGEYTQAQAFFTEALDIQRGLDDGATLFTTLCSMGSFMREAGDAPRALELHREALQFATSPMRTIRANIELTRDYAAMGKVGEALQAYNSAIAVPLENPDHPAQREAQLLYAEILVTNRSGEVARLREAEAIARSSLERPGSAADLPAEIIAHRILARVSRARGQNKLARQHLERAIDIVTNYSVTSTNPELRASSRASNNAVYSEYVDLLMASPPDSVNRMRALQSIESLRALNYESMSPTRGGGSADVRVSRLINDLADRSVSLAALRERSRPDFAAIRLLELDMATLRAEIDRALQGAESLTTSLADGRWRPVAASSAQLSYFIGASHAYVWSRDARGERAWLLPASAEALRKQISSIARIDPLQAPQEYDLAVLKLSEQLLPEGSITPGTTDIQIVADGELSLVPFAALRSPTDSARRFGETHVITRIPTLQVAKLAGEKGATRRWRLLAVDGNAAGSDQLSALPAAGNEIRQIAQSFGTQDASRMKIFRAPDASVTALRSAFEAGTDVMHFATHGLTDLRHPLASLLWLPTEKGARQTTYLSAGEIQGWHGNVGLVFLSACNSAVGPMRFGGEVAGLQSAFMHGGAENVIATLWPVEDAKAYEFADEFYRQLSLGHPPAMALAMTQRNWLASSKPGKAQKDYERRISGWGYVLYAR